jgi:hypothetical protein
MSKTRTINRKKVTLTQALRFDEERFLAFLVDGVEDIVAVTFMLDAYLPCSMRVHVGGASPLVINLVNIRTRGWTPRIAKRALITLTRLHRKKPMPDGVVCVEKAPPSRELDPLPEKKESP